MHQSHKAVKAKGLLAAHRDSACRWIENHFQKRTVFSIIAVCLVMQHCVLLMQNAFVCFAGDGLRLAASCSIRRVGAFLVF